MEPHAVRRFRPRLVRIDCENERQLERRERDRRGTVASTRSPAYGRRGPSQVSRERPPRRTGARWRTPLRAPFASRSEWPAPRAAPRTRRALVRRSHRQARRARTLQAPSATPARSAAGTAPRPRTISEPSRQLRIDIERIHAAQPGRATDNVHPARPGLLQQRHVWLVCRNQPREVLDLRPARAEEGAQVQRHDPQRQRRYPPTQPDDWRTRGYVARRAPTGLDARAAGALREESDTIPGLCTYSPGWRG